MSLHRVCSCCVAGVGLLKGVWCGTLPAACVVPTPAPVYIRDTVVCEGTGLPVESGDVIFYKGLCWTLTDDFEPPATVTVEPVEEVECLEDGCADERCHGTWYYAARACQHHSGACVLVEYCDARQMFADMFVPGVRAVHCVVFAISGVCYTLGHLDMVGHVDPSSCTVISGIGTWYRSCCDCSHHNGGYCASHEVTEPNHPSYSPAFPTCWVGDRQGGCCGSVYTASWTFRAKLELFSEPTSGAGYQKYRDDTITHSGSWTIGPRAACGSTFGKSYVCNGSFERELVDGFPGSQTTHTWSIDPCANFPLPDELVVNPPVGCGPGSQFVVDGGDCWEVGTSSSNPLLWMIHGAVPSLMGFETANGKGPETHCKGSETEDNVAGGQVVQRVKVTWSRTHGPGFGLFNYEHEISIGPPLNLVERLTMSATYTTTTSVECGTCTPPATPPVLPGGLDSMDGGGPPDFTSMLEALA